MSRQRRHQPRDHLGRFASPGTGSAPAGRLRAVRRRVAQVPGMALAALRGELARRIYRLALVAAALGVAVVLLYQHGDSSSTLRRVEAAAAAPAPPTRPAPTSSAAPTTTERAAPAAAARPTKPADVAAAWYAARAHLRGRQVRPLQQDKVSNREVRVLVLADRGNGRLDTALVRVHRDAKGRWSVP